MGIQIRYSLTNIVMQSKTIQSLSHQSESSRGISIQYIYTRSTDKYTNPKIYLMRKQLQPLSHVTINFQYLTRLLMTSFFRWIKWGTLSSSNSQNRVGGHMLQFGNNNCNKRRIKKNSLTSYSDAADWVLNDLELILALADFSPVSLKSTRSAITLLRCGDEWLLLWSSHLIFYSQVRTWYFVKHLLPGVDCEGTFFLEY